MLSSTSISLSNQDWGTIGILGESNREWRSVWAGHEARNFIRLAIVECIAAVSLGTSETRVEFIILIRPGTFRWKGLIVPWPILLRWDPSSGKTTPITKYCIACRTSHASLLPFVCRGATASRLHVSCFINLWSLLIGGGIDCILLIYVLRCRGRANLFPWILNPAASVTRYPALALSRFSWFLWSWKASFLTLVDVSFMLVDYVYSSIARASVVFKELLIRRLYETKYI